MKYGNLLGEEIEPCIFVPCNHFNNYHLLGLFASFYALPLYYDIITEENNISSGAGSVSIRRQKFAWKLGSLEIFQALCEEWSSKPHGIQVLWQSSGSPANQEFSVPWVSGEMTVAGRSAKLCVCSRSPPRNRGEPKSAGSLLLPRAVEPSLPEAHPCCCQHQQHWHIALISSRSFPLPMFLGSVHTSLWRMV